MLIKKKKQRATHYILCTLKFLNVQSDKAWTELLFQNLTNVNFFSCFWSFNPTALRMTKTLWSFDHSECKRVKVKNNYLHMFGTCENSHISREKY